MKTIYGVDGVRTVRMGGQSHGELENRARFDIARLTEFITANFPGDLGADWLADEGTVDVAIRLLEQLTMML